MYTIFGFEFSLVLSTRPKKALGDPEMWRQAEKQLAEREKALQDMGISVQGAGIAVDICLQKPLLFRRPIPAILARGWVGDCLCVGCSIY